MSLLLDDGTALRFGQDLAEVERLFYCSSVDNPLPIARKSIDRVVRLKDVSLEFDSARLRCITISEDYRYVHPPTPFPEAWKNFTRIENYQITNRMLRDDFLNYLAAWEERARTLKAERAQFGDLQELQYSISIKRDRFIDSVNVAMGPSRRARRGGIWCDGWNAFFSVDNSPGEAPVYKGPLKSLSAFRDEFNTVARHNF